jgi:hypothetical protein
MLGDLLGELRGKRVLRRVLPAEGGGLKVEVTFEDSGRMVGVDVNHSGTYVSVQRADGTLFGSGQGFMVTKDGGTATWKGHGLGKFDGGSVKYRGAIYYQSTSPQLARLNNVVGVFEFDADESTGKTHSRAWEWK